MTAPDKAYFQGLEGLPDGRQRPLDEVLGRLRFNDAGLLPVITQDHESGQVLMFAWMNRTALEATISTGRMTYWSRSRQSLWIKGETSGHFQRVVSLSFDCDGDALLCRVEQKGSACHTGRRSCFYLELDADAGRVNVVASP